MFQQLTETDSSESKTEKTPLKPGKGYGIAALICLLVPIMITFLAVTFEAHIVNPAWYNITFAMGPINMLCIAAAFVFGIMGRKTEGRLYANIVLAIVLSWGLYMLVCGIVYFVLFGILGHPT